MGEGENGEGQAEKQAGTERDKVRETKRETRTEPRKFLHEYYRTSISVAMLAAVALTPSVQV